MTQNEQNFINKINEMQNIIEWQKKAISERDSKIEKICSDNAIYDLLNNIHDYASDCNYESDYGLPLHGNNLKDIINIVKNHINTL